MGTNSVHNHQESQKDNSQSTVESNSGTDSESESEEELCYICTEPIATFAISECDHRTCHRCSLRLRALYETRNCAYCKAEQKVVIFTKDPEKTFEQFSVEDTPYIDKKLGIRFETQEMHKEAMHMLDFNCPQKECTESFKNWIELKKHVRKSHALNICDLCSLHKKVFPYEQSLYTLPQLTKHHHEGDKDFNKEDETGFSGHPECAFCKTRFYGDDELFIHCRDMHEQCFLCVRNGNRHEYYANYESLETHFKSDHYMCLYPQCLEKKFVVFDSAIDLKAHEVEVHGESVSGLQRSMQTDARRLDINFQYDSYRTQQQQQRSNKKPNHTNNNDNNSKKTTNAKKTSANNVVAASSSSSSSSSSAPVTLSQKEFPSMNSVRDAVPALPRVVPGASTKKGKGKGLQKPAGFGALSSTPSTSSTTTSPTASASASSSTTTNNQQPSDVVATHALFLSKVGEILKSKAKVAEFRSLTGAYRKSSITCNEYVDSIVKLTNNSIENSSKIFKGVEDLLDIEEKKWELIRAWRNKQTTMSQFPALDVREKAKPKASRVLVIKGPKPNTNNTNKNPKNVWDKVASAATVAATTKANNSRPSSARSSPQSSRPSSPGPSSANTFRSPTKTPWSGSSNSDTTPKNNFPSLKPNTFPSLPSSSPKHQVVLNMRRTASGQQINNAWGGTNSEDDRDSSAVEESDNSASSNKKKKGRKNKVLFRVGL